MSSTDNPTKTVQKYEESFKLAVNAMLSARQDYLASMKKMEDTGSISLESVASFHQEQFNDLRYRLMELLMEMHLSKGELWTRLSGSDIHFGTATLDIVANYLKNFKVIAGHAVGALKEVPHKGGRFSGAIESATNYRFLGTGPGSLRIGLGMPLPEPIDVQPNPKTTWGSSTLDEAIRIAMNAPLYGKEAVELIELSLRSADDDDAFEELKERVDTHGALRILHHAPRLFPSGVDYVELEGDMVSGGGVRFDVGVKPKIKKRTELLMKDEKYIRGVGHVAKNHWDNNSFELQRVMSVSASGLKKIAFDYDPDVFDILPFADSDIYFEGFLSFDAQGKPKRVKLDSIEPWDEKDSE